MASNGKWGRRKVEGSMERDNDKLLSGSLPDSHVHSLRFYIHFADRRLVVIRMQRLHISGQHVLAG